MSTVPGYGLVMGGAGGQLPASSPTPMNDALFSPDDYKLLGLDPPDEDEEDKNSILGNIIRGAGVGLLDPLSFIDPVDRVVQRLKQEADEGTANKVGYGLGYLAGFLVPGGAATKAGTYTAKGLQALTGAKLIKAADSGTELTRLGMLAQGSVAGGILSAGMSDAETPQEFLMETATGMVLGGVGDVAIQSAFRTIAGVAAKGKLPLSVEEAVKKAAVEQEMTPQLASMMGRAATIVDDMFASTNKYGDPLSDSFQVRKENLMLGLDELGLDRVKEGYIKVVPHFSTDVSDVKDVMKNFPDLVFEAVTRTTKEGDSITDVLIAPKELINRETIRSFRDHGFVPGQVTRYGGKDYILEKASQNPDFVMGFAAEGKGKLTPIPRSHMVLEPLIAPKTSKLWNINPHEEWAKFAKTHGVFPEMRVEQVAGNLTREQNGFDAAFNAMAAERGWTPQNKQMMYRYAAQRQNEILRRIDDGDMGKVLDGVNDVPTANVPHPNGEIEELAAQSGLQIQRVAGQPKKGSKLRRGKIVLDTNTGQKHGIFYTNTELTNFITKYSKEMPNMTPANPLASGATGLPPKASGVTQAWNQAELSNFTAPGILSKFGIFMPNLHYIRRLNDHLVKQLGDAAPDFYTPFSQLIADIAKSRSEAQPFLDRLSKARGGGLFKSSQVRVERSEKLFDLLETAKPGTAEWKAAAKELDLNDAEQAAGVELRSILNDLFEEAKKSGKIDIDAEDYIENYLPHIRQRNQQDWVAGYKKQHGKMPSAKMREFVHEMERTGTLTVYEKDPFMVTYRYINSMFFKKNVDDSWRKLNDLVDTSFVFNRNGEVIRPETGQVNPGMSQFAMSIKDTLAMLRGNQAETAYATRAAVEAVSKQLKVHLDEDTVSRTVNTLIAANYGAFMGWRPALAARNLSQIFMTTLPIVGPKYLGVGMRKAVADNAEEELIQMGIMAKGGSAVPLQDMLYYDTIERGIEGMRGQGISKLAAKAGKTVRYATQKSLGMQAWSDSLNRRVTYYAQKERTLDMLRRWSEEGWDETKFNQRVGLTMLGENATRSFHRMLPRENPVEAAKWLAKEVTNDTQFVYQAGAGPQVFNSQAGKLFGQYGTWPTWYGSFLAQNLTKGTTMDKVRFTGYTMAVHTAFMNAVYLTGINMSKWTALQFGWAGGPAFDVLKDVSDVVSGEMVSGEPTANRQLALSNYGMQDTGEGMFKIKDPRKMIEGTAGLFFPGMLLANDVRAATQEANPLAATARGLGFQLGDVQDRPDFMR